MYQENTIPHIKMSDNELQEFNNCWGNCGNFRLNQIVDF